MKMKEIFVRTQTKLEVDDNLLQDPQEDGGAEQCGDISNYDKDIQPNEDATEHLVLEKTRCDTSLGILTLRFKEMLCQSPNGVLDLKEASQQLQISKRRVYDITNVLEGIKLVKKKSKRHIEWMGEDKRDQINKELNLLREADSKLTELTKSCARQMKQLWEDQHCQRYAYLTYKDISSLASLKDQTVIVIKAPAESKLNVPHPDESFQIHLTSNQGPIDVFLCSNEAPPMSPTKGIASNSSSNPMRFFTLDKPEDPRTFLSSQFPFPKVGSEYYLSVPYSGGITDLFVAPLEQSPMDMLLT